MSSDDKNKTVFRPSPLQKRQSDAAPPRAEPTSSADPWEPVPSQPETVRSVRDEPMAETRSQSFGDTVPLPAQPRSDRNPLTAYAAPVLALAAALQTGRLQIPLSEFHRKATEAIAKFESVADRLYPENICQPAKYAVCATIDDVVQNLPGARGDSAEWAQRNMVVTFFRENIGGDRFLNFVQEVVKKPKQNRDLIELLHACLAAGFEGRFRAMVDGHSRKQAAMTELYSAMDHVRGLSQRNIVQDWQGENAPRKQSNFWSLAMLYGAVLAGLLFLIYLFFTVVLMSTGQGPKEQVSSLFPEETVTLNRYAKVFEPPVTTTEMRLREFLADEIRAGHVIVDGNRVRTSIGSLFAPASDRLSPGRRTIFEKIGAAAEFEDGLIIVEGHTDSDPVSTVRFRNNIKLSQARALTVANIIRTQISNPARLRIQGLGDTLPVSTNSTLDGKAKNRRVEIVFERAL